MLRASYAKHFEDYQGATLEALQHYADPHEKKLLRIHAMAELIENGDVEDSRSLWVKSVLWKLKKNEWAKPGKKPRSIGDLGVGASLLGFRLTHFLKTAQANEPVEINGGHMSFCKSPDPFELERHFKNLIDPPGRFYLLYFSDDACLAIRNPRTKKVDRYNLDISSCDASHGPGLFNELICLMPDGPTKDDMTRLVKQCAAPLRIYSCSGDKRERVVMRPTSPRLYSGSTITTGINNLANLCIGLAISQLDYTGVLDNDGVCQEIVRAAASAGYIITGANPLEFIEDIQFLKNSPVLDIQGNWRPLVNLGVFLRASGACNGDLPGTGPLRPRAEAFQRGLLKCTFPYASSALIGILNKRLGTGPTLITKDVADSMWYKTRDNPNYPPFIADDTSMYRRYGLDGVDVCELEYDFGSMGYGEHYHGPSVSKILDKDYGLKTVQCDNSNYLFQHHNAHFVPELAASAG
jgi:hypothetical protein